MVLETSLSQKIARNFFRLLCMVGLLALSPSPAMALNEGLQCVPYARAITGVEIYGDAHTWWGKAKGRYERGKEPRVGAVLSFKSHGSSRLGHISAVRAIVDKRTILVSHANWSRINGKRGHIEDDVQVVDVSKKNDWSQVKVWYQPIGALGGTIYPINGFIYPKQQKSYAAIKASIAELTGRPISRVALTEKPNLGTIQGAASNNEQRRMARLSHKKRQQEKKRNLKTFELDQNFLRELEKESQAEKRQTKAALKKNETASASNEDLIGDLLGQVGQ